MDWIRWVAFDSSETSNIRMWLYENKPEMRSTYWYSGTGRMSSKLISNIGVDWKTSLLEVPVRLNHAEKEIAQIQSEIYNFGRFSENSKKKISLEEAHQIYESYVNLFENSLFYEENEYFNAQHILASSHMNPWRILKHFLNFLHDLELKKTTNSNPFIWILRKNYVNYGNVKFYTDILDCMIQEFSIRVTCNDKER
jgi:hypothetical protein